MAQATRCPHCQTAFKVVRDQLLLREGWVRCGQCGEPFNALDHLIDPGPPAPPRDAAAPAAEPSPASAPQPPSAPQAEPPAQLRSVPSVPYRAQMHWQQPTGDQSAVQQGFLPLTAQPYAPRTSAQDAHADETTRQIPIDRAQSSSAVAAVPQAATASPHEQAPAAAQDDGAPLSEFNLIDALHYRFEPDDATADRDGAAPASAASAREPEFLRQAQRQARWRSTPVRVALAVLSLLLGLTLAAQAALFWRDTLAQQWPASRPWLQRLCQVTTGCQLSAPRDLDALVIDASALAPTPQGLRLSVLLRNRLDRAVAWPAIELTLTDAQDRIQQRKVLEPAQYLPATLASAPALRAGIAPGQQIQLQLHLALTAAAPAGYKLVLFYP
ncbi:MAG: zinc-ribbon and DUF3426 domain-containing protein [Thiomonas sp.]